MKKVLSLSTLLIAQSLSAGIDELRNKFKNAIHAGSYQSVYNLTQFSYNSQLLLIELKKHQDNNQTYKNTLLQDKRTFNFWSLGKGAASGIGCYGLFQFLNTNETTAPIRAFALSAMAGFAYLGITNIFEGLNHKSAVNIKIAERNVIDALLDSEIQKRYGHRPWAEQKSNVQ